MINYSKPGSAEDISRLSPLNFDDYDFVVAFKQHAWRKNNFTEIEMPPELGTI